MTEDPKNKMLAMTDPRIETALDAAWSHTTQYVGGMSFSAYEDISPDAAGEFRKAIIAAIAAADAADPLAKIEGVLWCVTVAGPYELHAVPDYCTGVRKARELNEWLARNNKPDENGPIIIFALVDEWPWDAESHAKDLVRQEKEEAVLAARREKKRLAELGAGNG